MTKAKKQDMEWIQDRHWIRTKTGEWLNRAYVRRINLGANNTIFVITDDSCSYLLMDGFETMDAAQAHLDKLQIFYELKAV